MLLFVFTGQAWGALDVAPVEDVMTSGFFQGANRVRGYSGDGRAVHRVSTDAPFGTAGAETIYITFDPNSFVGISSPVPQALLSVTSTSGGFGADASTGTPFLVSAHGVTADPVADITDDTNPGGPIDWVTFLNSNIQPTAPESLTLVDGFGVFTFDVTGVVNDWLSGGNTTFALALTGSNDVSGVEFLHGFVNNSQTPGSTFLTIVPEPASLGLLSVGGLLFAGRRRKLN